MMIQLSKVGKLKNLIHYLHLPQFISEPISFKPNKTPSCNGYKQEDKVKVDNFRKECQEALKNAKLS